MSSTNTWALEAQMPKRIFADTTLRIFKLFMARCHREGIKPDEAFSALVSIYAEGGDIVRAGVLERLRGRAKPTTATLGVLK